ncbi:hypothetical protein [Azotobacter salinestris]|uniref:hypothetical protein n=1 Tax=Azotobacter salinestris TaxID=69964 RepID=UPI0032DEFE59
MSEAVKRYGIGECYTIGGYSQMLEDEAGEWVLAADHDRIVSSLTEAGVKMQAERDAAAQRCRELEAQVDQLKREERLRHADASYYANTSERLRAEVEQARGTAEYWKAGLLSANAEVERLQGLLKEARYPVAHYLSDREEASDRAPTKSMRYEAGQSVLKVRRLLINIDAALEASR